MAIKTFYRVTRGLSLIKRNLRYEIGKDLNKMKTEYKAMESASTAILKKQMTSNWISSKSLEFLPYHHNTIYLNISKLIKDKSISAKNLGYKKGGRHFRLLGSGYEVVKKINLTRFITCFDPDDYSGLYNESKIERLGHQSVIKTMLERSGYAVFKDDKPPLELSLHSTRKLTNPDALTGFKLTKHLLENYKLMNYYADYIKELSGNSILDTYTYRRRFTCVNCFYTHLELLNYYNHEANENTDVTKDAENKKGIDHLRYSRMQGTLLTPHGAFLTYATHDTAIRINPQSESSTKTKIDLLVNRIYQSNIAPQRKSRSAFDNYDKNISGTLLFGNEDYKAVFSIFRETDYASEDKTSSRIDSPRKIRNVINNFNLVAMEDVYFVPTIKESLPMLSIMQYPDWNVALNKYSLQHSPMNELSGNLVRDCTDEGTLFNGRIGTPAGTIMFFNLFSLNMDNIYDLIGIINRQVDMEEKSRNKFLFQVLPWQEPLFNRLKEEWIIPEQQDNLRLEVFPADTLEKIALELETKHQQTDIWSHGGYDNFSRQNID